MWDRVSFLRIASVILFLAILAPGGASNASEVKPPSGINMPLALCGRPGVSEPPPGPTNAGSLNINASRYWLPDTLETGWLASDKKLHLLACYSIVLTGEVAADRMEAGVIGAVALSLGKELWDLWFKMPRSRRGMSKGDLVADAVGIGVGILIVETFGQ
jgi:hypothetical protein